jgi:hypothetical protein
MARGFLNIAEIAACLGDLSRRRCDEYPQTGMRQNSLDPYSSEPGEKPYRDGIGTRR